MEASKILGPSLERVRRHIFKTGRYVIDWLITFTPMSHHMTARYCMAIPTSTQDDPLFRLSRMETLRKQMIMRCSTAENSSYSDHIPVPYLQTDDNGCFVTGQIIGFYVVEDLQNRTERYNACRIVSRAVQIGAELSKSAQNGAELCKMSQSCAN